MIEPIKTPKAKEDMTWEEERPILLKNKPKLLKIAESCDHFLCGFCCESLDAGRTWECVFIRDCYKKGEEISCGRYEEIFKKHYVKKINGRRTYICNQACGTTKEKSTKDINEVTCKNCLKNWKKMSLKITVKCVCCGFKKEVGEEQKEMPMCDKCFSPMIAEKAEIKKG